MLIRITNYPFLKFHQNWLRSLAVKALQMDKEIDTRFLSLPPILPKPTFGWFWLEMLETIFQTNLHPHFNPFGVDFGKSLKSMKFYVNRKAVQP